MKILILAGGDSNERAVSLDSGVAICQALERLGHQVQAIDPASGQNLIGADGQFSLVDDTSDKTTPATLNRSFAALTSGLSADYTDDILLSGF